MTWTSERRSLSLPTPWSILFHSYPFPPGASREELLPFYCGLLGRIHQPTDLLQSWCRPHVTYPTIHTHTHTHTGRKELKATPLCYLPGCNLCCSVFECCGVPPAHPPQPGIIFVHLPATPIEHSKNGCCAIYLNFPNLLTFFVWPASPWARSLKTTVVQQLW